MTRPTSEAALLLISGVVALIWVAGGIVLLRRAKKSVEIRDIVFIMLSFAVGAGWAGSFGFFSRTAGANTAKASLVPPAWNEGDRTPRSCAAVRLGMSAGEVRRILGDPTQSSPEEDIWGPGAVRWSYTGSRCRVHLLDDVVHMVD